MIRTDDCLDVVITGLPWLRTIWTQQSSLTVFYWVAKLDLEEVLMANLVGAL